MDTSIELRFGDGRYLFFLPFPQIIELERKCGYRLADGRLVPKSIFQIYDEMSQGIGIGSNDGMAKFIGGGAASATDIAETIRLGLIGGNSGMVNGEEIEVGPMLASDLVENYVKGRPLAEGLAVAWAVINAAIMGIDLKKKAKAKGPRADANMSRSKKG